MESSHVALRWCLGIVSLAFLVGYITAVYHHELWWCAILPASSVAFYLLVRGYIVAFLFKCPSCGKGLKKGLSKKVRICPSCGLDFDEELPNP
jgi:uncharacterized protein (DUF983 family)